MLRLTRLLVILSLAPALIAAVTISGCANPHTLESTESMSDADLSALCADLQMRADMNCEWDMKQQQSSIPDQQTWEINCRARRDSARDSFDNVCMQPRVLQQQTDPEKN
jgi:hypothetical protein